MGPVVARFEEAVGSFVGARHCVAVSSGTAALHLALEAVGVRGHHMSDVNAAVGVAQLERADALIEDRRRVARRYDEAFRDLPGLLLLPHDLAAEVPSCYTVRVPGGGREVFMRALAADGIETAVLYPPSHRQPAFARFAGHLPVTERVASQYLSLPLFAGMSDAQVDHVISRVVAHRHRHDLSA